MIIPNNILFNFGSIAKLINNFNEYSIQKDVHINKIKRGFAL